MLDWSKIGYGTWPLTGDANGSVSYGKVNEVESIKAMMYAYSCGVNVYDTADFYGYGYVESLMGDVFHRVRDQITIITKGGMISNDGAQDFSISHLFGSLTKSLARLKTTYIDVYMLHSPKLEVLKDGHIMWWLKTMKEVHLIKEYGISLIRPEDGFEAINKYEFPIIEVNYNLMDRRAETNGLFDLCMLKKVKTIIRTPLAQGILSGKFQFSEDSADRRNSWSPEYVDRITKTYKSMLDSLDGNSYTDAQNCLRFCLSHPAVCTIIPGMKKVEEVVENISTLNFPKLTTEEHKKLMGIYTKEI